MTNVKSIIAKYRTGMESAGLMRRTAPVQLSPQTAALRPSLTKVQEALRERPDRFAIVQPSPIALLFDYTLPKIEHILIEIGEEKAEEIIGKLCEHGKEIISKHGIDRAKEHLESLFNDLPDYEVKIREENGVSEIIDAYRSLDFENNPADYLKLMLGEEIEALKIDSDGAISLHLSISPQDSDLICLKKIHNLQQLDLSWTQITDAGLQHLANLSNLQQLYLGETQITDAGLRHFANLSNLKNLSLWGTKITNDGLRHLANLSNLQQLYLGETQITDAGLQYLANLSNLQHLDLNYTKITDAGVEELKKAIPGVRIVRD